MNRRRFLRSTALLVGSTGLLRDRTLWAEASANPWRTFDLTTHLDLPVSDTATRAWVPLPLRHNVDFQQHLNTTVQCENGDWTRVTQAENNLELVSAHFPAHSKPSLTVISRVRVRDRSVDLQTPGRPQALPTSQREFFLRSTLYVPTDGIVRSKALEITAAAKTDEDKAQAIYNWIVTNAYRKADVRGCGKGDIRPLLETGDLGGKCADLSALFVGLARAAGLPARDVYGIRVAPSRLGYKSLGPSTAVVSHAQHCRAEVWLQRFGWVPVDPADVRKVMLEEPPGNLSADDTKVRAARKRLFGSWEMNWIAYNYAQEVSLPGSDRSDLPFLMYPQAEMADGRLDCLDPERFRYEIAAAEV